MTSWDACACFVGQRFGPGRQVVASLAFLPARLLGEGGMPGLAGACEAGRFKGFDFTLPVLFGPFDAVAALEPWPRNDRCPRSGLADRPPGLLIAGILSATMGSLFLLLNTMANSMVTDRVRPLWRMDAAAMPLAMGGLPSLRRSRAAA